MEKTILIIEDDTFLQGLVARKLSGEGFKIEAAANGEEGLKIMGSTVPDLILLDLLLPNIDGFEVLARMRTDTKLHNVRVMVFSNLSEEKDIKRAKDLGVIDYLVKANFTLDELASRIKEVLTLPQLG
ncbi:MAG TPA: response regulator [Candidatus Paceibacterota bacterium]|nr:response regulator [Candidatus Paceibacterota bacterium]